MTGSGNDRLSSMRLWTTGSEFLSAAKLVRAHSRGIAMPTYFLLCQSIELTLKAYLRGSEASEPALKKLGHKLDAILAMAERSGLGSVIVISPQDRALINGLSGPYAGKDLQYTTRGFKTYSDPGLLEEFADRLQKSLREFACNSIGVHAGKPSAVV